MFVGLASSLAQVRAWPVRYSVTIGVGIDSQAFRCKCDMKDLRARLEVFHPGVLNLIDKITEI